MVRAGRGKDAREQYASVAVRVQGWEASTDASINYAVYAPHAWDSIDNSPLYAFKIYVTITGVCLSPAERAGDSYELTMYGEYSQPSRLDATLKEAQQRDKFGSPRYRTYRGKQIPVYDPPKGLATIKKVRGQTRWTSWLPVQPHFANDLLTLLGHQRPLFISIVEREEGRVHWIQGFSVQTAAPEED